MQYAMKASSGLAMAGLLTLAALGGCQKGGTPAAASSATPAAPPAPVAAAPAALPAAAPAAGPLADPVNVTDNAAPTGSGPGDIPGTSTPAFLKRYQGSKIIAYVSRSFDTYTLHTGTRDAQKTSPMEGAITRIVYRVPAGHTALELLRNYEETFKDAGFVMTGEYLPCQGAWVEGAIYLSLATPQIGNPLGQNATVEPVACSFSALGKRNNQPVGAQVAVVEKHAILSVPDPSGKPPMVFKDGEIIAIVDLVTGKPVKIDMVSVKAADMADALATKGVVDLYGVYFDTDKTAVKPDSKATLDEVASLLKIDRSLRLEISGHTDNAGSPDHNLKLSQGRAQAVVQTLVTQYGIDAGRLVAKGYGDTKPVAANNSPADMAKNRRVELRKL
ncbi:MAG: OmpA family protein [Phenylobacterium sp.]